MRWFGDPEPIGREMTALVRADVHDRLGVQISDADDEADNADEPAPADAPPADLPH